MQNYIKDKKKVSNRYGLLLFGGLTAYFLLMRGLGLGHEYWLRLFNIFIVFGSLVAAMAHYKRISDREYYAQFFDFYKVGMRTALVGIGSFALFLALYFDLLDPVFLQEAKRVENLSPILSPVMAAGLVFFEGIGSALLCSYLAIHLLKYRTVEKPLEPANSH